MSGDREAFSMPSVEDLSGSRAMRVSVSMEYQPRAYRSDPGRLAVWCLSSADGERNRSFTDHGRSSRRKRKAFGKRA